MKQVRSRRQERAPVLPEDRAAVEHFRRHLKRHGSQLADTVRAFERRWKRQGVDTLHGVGIPLRPLFIPRARLDALSEGFQQGMARLLDQLSRDVRQPEALHRQVPVGAKLLGALAPGLASPHTLTWFRPDGFLLPDRYVLGEINYGNGVVVSIGYTECLFDLFSTHPAFLSGGFARGDLDRPFMGWLAAIEAAIDYHRPAHVALISHREEWPFVVEDSDRVRHQVEQAVKRLLARGLSVSFGHEDEAWVDSRGRARLKGSSLPVDLFVMVTISCSFIDRPEPLWGAAKALTGTHVGAAPILKPLIGVALDKGVLPYANDTGALPVACPDGTWVVAPDTWYVGPEAKDFLLENQRQLVIKRSFVGKDTVIGAGVDEAAWARAVARSANREYVVQRYQPLPRTDLPVLIDGKVEWIPVRVELTPFIVHGRYSGALARYAPDAPGLVLSPPPEGMGMTMVYAT